MSGYPPHLYRLPHGGAAVFPWANKSKNTSVLRHGALRRRSLCPLTPFA